ncbi:Zn(II)2Cys6 transcription factor, partial [Candidatus Bathyarchaeota archaeon]|nr:Zn(II)2Cys6 transcription factor [Candidatus Bathyarchaeota archaeon]
MASRPKQNQDSRIKQSRTSSHKVRTGCVTCKKRHLKCDETRPRCGNCLRSRRQCEGYVEARKGNPGFGQFRWDSKEVTRRPACPRAQLHLDQDILDFRDSTSALHFNEFVGLVQGPWIVAVSGGDLWNVTLPQVSRNSSTLRHAAMAIGALSIWHRQSKNKSLSEGTPPALPAGDGDAIYFQAMAHYGQCLKLQSKQT